jgi:hypothetical protein
MKWPRHNREQDQHSLQRGLGRRGVRLWGGKLDVLQLRGCWPALGVALKRVESRDHLGLDCVVDLYLHLVDEIRHPFWMFLGCISVPLASSGGWLTVLRRKH